MIGFGFNLDDEHINGIIRTLVEFYNKQLVVVRLAGGKSDYDLKKEIADNLKVRKKDNIHVLQVDKNRCKEGEKWTDVISKMNFS